MVTLFTCTVCNTRSAKQISKQAYNHGVVLVRCPGCNNLHLFADRLGFFEDNPVDVEQILKEKGQSVRRMSFGYLSGIQAASDSGQAAKPPEDPVAAGAPPPVLSSSDSESRAEESSQPATFDASLNSEPGEAPDEDDATAAIRRAIQDGVFELSEQDLALLRGEVDGYGATAKVTGADSSTSSGGRQ